MSTPRREGDRGRFAAAVTAGGMMVSVAAMGCTPAVPKSAPTAAEHTRYASRSHAAPGAQLWASRYDGPTGSYPVPAAIAASPDGSAVFVTGASRVQTRQAAYSTVGYDAATGRQLWASRYEGPGKSVDGADAIAVSPDGRIVFVTGRSGPVYGGPDYATIAYSASTGRQLWLRRYSGPGGYALARALVVSPDGKTVFVTGYSGGENYTPQANDAYTTIAYDVATGAQRWISRLKGPANGNNQARNIAISPDGGTVYVTGRSFRTTSRYDDLTVAYNAATGTQLWATRYSNPANRNDYANAIAVAPDGQSVYVTGGSRGKARYAAVATTLAYNAVTGAQRWAAISDNPDTKLSAGGSLAVTPDGRTVLVAGPGLVDNHVGYAAVAYNATTGAAAWTRLVLGQPAAIEFMPSQALAISPDSSTFYATGVPIGNCCNYGTVAYTVARGTQQWQSNGVRKKYEQAFALALSPDGSTLYVTGVSERPSGFGTIAYKT